MFARIILLSLSSLCLCFNPHATFPSTSIRGRFSNKRFGTFLKNIEKDEIVSKEIGVDFDPKDILPADSFDIRQGGEYETKRRKSVKNVIGFTKSEYDAEIFSLALPTLGAVLIDPCLSLVDTAFVGKLGAVALGSIGPCTALFNFIFATASTVLMVSTSVLVAKHKASNNTKGVSKVIAISAFLSLSIGSVLAVLFGVFPTFFLKIMGTPPSLIQSASSYLIYRAMAMPFSMFLLVAGGLFRGIGDPMATLKNGALVGLLNLILDPILMFPMKLGVAGAAIATSVSQFVGALTYGITLFKRRKELGLDKMYDSKPNWIPSLDDAKEFFDAGSSLMLRSICNVGCWTAMASAATRMGVYEIASHQLLLSLWLVIAFAQDAVGVAGQVMVAKKIGITKHESDSRVVSKSIWDARAISKRILQISFISGTIMAIAARLIVPKLIPSFCSNVEVVRMILDVLPMALFGFPLCCVVWTWDSLYYGAYDFLYNARTIAFTSSLATVGIFIVLKRNLGIRGLWLNMIYAYFVPRFFFHHKRFNEKKGPFGRSSIDLEKDILKF